MGNFIFEYLVALVRDNIPPRRQIKTKIWRIKNAEKNDSALSSVTRLGNLLDFGQLFKAFDNNNLPKSPTFLGNFCKAIKICTRFF